MSRSIVVHGEALIYVKGPAGSSIAALSELGLADNDINITITPLHRDVIVNAWGEAPADVQRKIAFITATFNLIQYDPDILEECARLSLGGAAFGQTGRAGALMGNGLARFAAGNNFIGFNIAAQQSSRPWRFLFSYMKSPIGPFIHGTNPGTIACQFVGVPYIADPWNGGAGALNNPFFDRTADT